MIIGLSAFLKSSYEIFEITNKIRENVVSKPKESLSSGFEGIEVHLPSQHSPKWGWAASIQAVLAYKGILASQAELVAHTQGVLNPHAFSGEYEQFSLNIQEASFPSARKILRLIELDHPFLIASENRAYVFESFSYKIINGRYSIEHIKLGNTMSPLEPHIDVNPKNLRMPRLILVNVKVKNG